MQQELANDELFGHLNLLIRKRGESFPLAEIVQESSPLFVLTSEGEVEAVAGDINAEIAGIDIYTDAKVREWCATKSNCTILFFDCLSATEQPWSEAVNDLILAAKEKNIRVFLLHQAPIEFGGSEAAREQVETITFCKQRPAILRSIYEKYFKGKINVVTEHNFLHFFSMIDDREHSGPILFRFHGDMDIVFL